MSKHRKVPGHKPPGDKKQKTNGKKEVKDKVVAAELGEAVMREEAPKPAPAPVSRAERPALAKSAVKEKAPEPAPLAVKEKAPEPPPPLATKEKAPEPPAPAAKAKTPELAASSPRNGRRYFRALVQGGRPGHRRGQSQADRLHSGQCVVRFRLRQVARLGLEPGADHAVADELLGRAPEGAGEPGRGAPRAVRRTGGQGQRADPRADAPRPPGLSDGQRHVVEPDIFPQGLA